MGYRYDRSIDSEHFDPALSQEKILMQIQPGSKVLECGCATGYMTRYMRDSMGCEVSIVEYDAEAYAVARQYASDGICADLTRPEWLSKFQGKQFDYILFADVLEHLYDPQAVLKSVIPLLKEGGSILASVPNVAHGDVLMNLWRGNWNYTETGLLDKTHIRFFAQNNLESFFQAAGLSIVRLDYTILPIGQTEQALSSSGAVNAELKVLNVLSESKSSIVYQFIITAQSTEYVGQHPVEKEQLMQTMATLYYSQGEGFSEEKTQKIFYTAPDFHQRFEWKSIRPTALRFDPVERQMCIITSLQVLSNEGELEIYPANGYRMGHTDVFGTGDPQYSITVGDKSIEWIEIHAQIGLVSNGQIQSGMAQLARNCVELEEARYAQDVENQELRHRAQELQDEVQGFRQTTQALQQEIQELQDEVQACKEEQLLSSRAYELELEQERECGAQAQEKLTQELAHIQTHYHAAIAQRNDLKWQLDQTQNAYNIISNAFFWKITRPLRWMVDGVKTVLRKNRFARLCWKGLKCWKENGSAYTWRKLQDKLHHRQDYTKLRQPLFSKGELEQQKKDVFSRNIKISVLVPLYNTPEKFLHEMIQSVLDQTYTNWELCMADGSDEQHRNVEGICRQYVKKDSRVRYKKLEKNRGISENTNACIDISQGDYVALFDHDDLLHPAALHEVMKAICERGADFIYTDENTFHEKPEDAYTPHFKPDFAPDTLRSYNYICHFTAFSRDLLKKVGGFRSEFDGSQDYDLVLRLTEQAKCIVHIPKILYYWRSHSESVASDVSAKPYTISAAKKALGEHLERINLPGEVCDSSVLTTYRIRYELRGTPLVSILIPNKDHVEDLRKCILAVLEKSTYPNWEIIVIENNSVEPETFEYYTSLKEDKRIKVVTWKDGFNYSAINNFGAKYANGEHLILLNNDIEVITPDWIEEMLMFSQRKDVGAVGCMLYYPDNTIQHAGVILGLGSVAGHSHKYFLRNDCGYMYRLTIAQNYSAVTAACMMIRRDVWDEVGGLDEKFEVAFNDVDLCMRIRSKGYLIVWTPYAELYHYESKSRGYEDTPEKQARFSGEIRRFQKRWGKELEKGDPYYNPNLTLAREDFSLR